MTIDWWTLGIQTVNIAILIWLLQRFFWRPVAEVEKTRAGFAAERDAILMQAQAAASKANAATLTDTARRVAELECAATAAIATDQAAAAKAWAERSSTLAVDIAGRLAGRLDGPAVQASFLDWLLAQLRALPADTRRAAEGAALEVVSATPIEPAEQARITGLIAAALGATPHLTYRTDPALIAGLELHGPHLVVQNSWQADLAAIQAGVGHDRAG